MYRLLVASLVLGSVLCLEVNSASAQPSQRTPVLTPYNPPSTINGFPDPNSRVRPSPNQVGLQSADIYAKNGYPKMLGDAVEQGSSSGGTGGSTTGTIGQFGQFGGGFQGNTGNQIGQMSGGTIFGGIFGGGGGGGGGSTIGGGFLNRGVTGGGFSGGMMPKGFGFGGTPDFTKTWTPLNGGPNK